MLGSAKCWHVNCKNSGNKQHYKLIVDLSDALTKKKRLMATAMGTSC